MSRLVPRSIILTFFVALSTSKIVGTTIDGAWTGSAQMSGRTVMMMMMLQTKERATTGAVALPMEKVEAHGTLAIDGQHLRFSGKAGSEALDLDGHLEQRSFIGTIHRGAESGTFALYRSMSPNELAPLEGFYRDGPRRFIYVQPWDEIGQFVMLNETGELRALFPQNDATFINGPSMIRTHPVEATFTFVRNEKGEVVALKRHAAGGHTRSYVKSRLYGREDLQFRNGEITLAGSLLKPTAGKAPYPVVVLTHGSGDQDRNAALIFMISLLEKGIAILSYDKRGVGGSSGSWMRTDFQGLASDALAAVDVLKSRPDVDAKHIGVWGLSQGGWIAPLAASRSKDIAFVVAVSAAAVTPAVQELTRTKYEMLAGGETAEDIELSDTLYRAMNHWVRTGEGWDEYTAVRQRAVGKRWGPSAEPPSKGNPYYQFWRLILDYDPVPVLEKVTCPMLVVYGGLDQNVRPADNAGIVGKALRAAGNKDYKIIVYPKGNHLMMEGKTGSARELAELDRFVPGYFDTVTAWVLERVGAGSVLK